jgi:hypothetical protein
LEEAGIVPIINWQARQEEWITTRIRRPQNRRDAIFIPMLHQHVPQLPLEFVARFRKCLGIRKRMDRSAQLILNHLLGSCQFFFHAIHFKQFELWMCNRMRSETDSLGVQLSNLSPRQAFLSFKSARQIVNECRRQENRRSKLTLGKDRECVFVKIVISVVKRNDNEFSVAIAVPKHRESFSQADRSNALIAEAPDLTRKDVR